MEQAQEEHDSMMKCLFEEKHLGHYQARNYTDSLLFIPRVSFSCICTQGLPVSRQCPVHQTNTRCCPHGKRRIACNICSPCPHNRVKKFVSFNYLVIVHSVIPVHTVSLNAIVFHAVSVLTGNLSKTVKSV